MAQDSFKVSAPGSLMLFGEHAVLHGQPAIVAAVQQRISITVTPKTDRKVRIRSELGQFEEHIDELEAVPPFTFMLTAIQNDPVFTGALFEVDAGFKSTVGLGSSAAVSVATVAALRHLRGLAFDPTKIFADSILEVRQAQGGRGSGSDVAASVHGGLVYYQMEPRELVPLHGSPPPLSLIYSGYKVPTPVVIEQVNATIKKNPAAGKKLFEEMGRITKQAREAVVAGDWSATGECMNAYQACQRQLGVSNEDLDDIVDGLRQSPGILGAKISGSGLGDCVVGIGHAETALEDFEKIPIAVGSEGVQFD